LEEAPRAVGGKEGAGDGRRPNDAARGEVGLGAGFEIHHPIAADESAQPGRLTVVGIADDLHGERASFPGIRDSLRGLRDLRAYLSPGAPAGPDISPRGDEAALL